MNVPSQWVHQHNVLLLCAALVGGTCLILIFRCRSLRLWLLWSGLTVASLAALAALRTPAASISEHQAPESATTARDAAQPRERVIAYSEPDLNSVDAIEEVIARAGKPTLVELYADYGVS